MASIPGQPLIEELQPSLSPLELFTCIHSEKESFFLDSAMDSEKLGRYSLMGCDPFLIFSSRGENISITQGKLKMHVKGNPFEVLGRCLKIFRLENPSTLPCIGGAVGFLSYDLGRFVESLPSRAVDDLNLPEACLGFYDVMLVHDNRTQQTFLISTGFPEMDPFRRAVRARERLQEFKARLRKPPIPSPAGPSFLQSAVVVPRSNFTYEGYIQAVNRARQYIIDGDIFEVNLSQRYETEIQLSPFELYKRLRKINPAPFASYLNFKEVTVAGASPERFLRLQGELVETRPIKGTIRRGKTPEEDAANAQRLLSSAKDRAENMMIVDLERNDLGRVCRYGSVKVTELAVLEAFPTVFHLTSTVVGRLKQGLGCIDLLKATFPGGSITGAPKIRSMEIIDELEPTRRSIYTGSTGYFSFDGNLDLNIVIRTFLIKSSRAYFQVGGAVVYDSDPEAEYQETLDKGRALFAALTSSGLQQSPGEIV